MSDLLTKDELHQAIERFTRRIIIASVVSAVAMTAAVLIIIWILKR